MAVPSKKVDGGRQSLCKEKQINKAQDTTGKIQQENIFCAIISVLLKLQFFYKAVLRTKKIPHFI